MRIVLLTARDPLAAGDGPFPAAAATDLAGEGHEVVLVLLEDAVTLLRSGHRNAGELATALSKGVRVVAEDEALARRAINLLDTGVEPASLGETVELLMTWSDRQAWL